MQFTVLGSLEVVNRGVVAPIKGTKQRAVLAYLLLHANQVVATSKLLKALWPEKVPPTARKMVQNAVSGLRNVLAAHADQKQSALLLTHAPGYVLRVPPERVDLLRFETLAQAARTSLAQGHSDQAAQALREALRLWRGPVLADLVESGVNWPELTKIRDMHVAVQEDYFNIQLDHGRHIEILPELEQVFGSEPHRERLCRQLMTALYRAGRHVDALQVYRRTRDALQADLGLEPGRELRDLERAILEHDSALQLPAPVQPAQPDEEPPSSAFLATAEDFRPAAPVPAPAAVVPAQENVRRAVAPEAVTERRLVSVMAVTLRQRIDRDPEEVEQLLGDIAEVVREVVDRACGTVVGTTGSLLLLSVFGVPRTRDDDAPRAVRAALRIRDRLLALDSLTTAGADVRLAVATGEVLAKYPLDGDSTPTITGTVVDTCVLMTNAAHHATVWICDVTRQASASLVICSEQSEVASMWRVEAVRDTPVPGPQRHVRAPFLGRDVDLDLLHRMLNQAERHARPQLLTILGEAGIGKSRLVEEFVQSVAASGTPGEDAGNGVTRTRPKVLTAHIPDLCEDVAARTLAGIARECLGIRPGETMPDAQAKLSDALDRHGVGCEHSERLMSWLRPLVLSPSHDGLDIEQAFFALRALLEAMAAKQPLITVFEDLHLADEQLLEFVARLSHGFGSVPLLVIVTARPELLTAHPGWQGTARNATTVTLEPLPDSAMAELLNSGLGTPNGVWPEQLRQSILTKVNGNPLFAMEYAAAIGTGRFHEELPPDQVRRVLTAQLTTLSPDEKTVLKDAAVLGEMITAAGIAAVGEYGEDHIDDISHCLARLERKRLLRRAPYRVVAEKQTYEFSQVLIRDISYLELPRAQRAAKHRNAASWIDSLANVEGWHHDPQHPLRMHHHRHVTAAAGKRMAPYMPTIVPAPDRSIGTRFALSRREAMSRVP
ncbi:BTAD domain-containing putative transcriptional regulator [Kibdelosporangium persicum]|uniref:Transcriptional regulatory protein, C terminal n=1 Tax=Kibdelosporangium persicum TaxID=2698649 RepID=A0ABX2FDP0_9PSEU|nr:BTAD domain-containing putative transcriptional regulator [Kibdelosporangium persicum]NRN69484.1 Transcriptional regulatory protein, C terminal [Kibdelosporangium persicum]